MGVTARRCTALRPEQVPVLSGLNSCDCVRTVVHGNEIPAKRSIDLEIFVRGTKLVSNSVQFVDVQTSGLRGGHHRIALSYSVVPESVTLSPTVVDFWFVPVEQLPRTMHATVHVPTGSNVRVHSDGLCEHLRVEYVGQKLSVVLNKDAPLGGFYETVAICSEIDTYILPVTGYVRGDVSAVPSEDDGLAGARFLFTGMGD